MRDTLPLHQAPAPDQLDRFSSELTQFEDACSLDDGCITCGDVALPLTVVEVGELDARCRDDEGREELVAVDLIDDVQPGDVLLVHAKVAIERLDPQRLEGRA